VHIASDLHQINPRSQTAAGQNAQQPERRRSRGRLEQSMNSRKARSLLRLLFYRHTPQTFTAAALWGTVWGVVIFAEPQKFKFSETRSPKNEKGGKGNANTLY
jgi:hypothetical protein